MINAKILLKFTVEVAKIFLYLNKYNNIQRSKWIMRTFA